MADTTAMAGSESTQGICVPHGGALGARPFLMPVCAAAGLVMEEIVNDLSTSA